MLTLAEYVLNQTTFHNGHGQAEMKEMKLMDLIQLCRDMETLSSEQGEDRSFYIQLWPDTDTTDGGASIYQAFVGSDKMWFSVDKVIMPEEED